MTGIARLLPRREQEDSQVVATVRIQFICLQLLIGADAVTIGIYALFLEVDGLGCRLVCHLTRMLCVTLMASVGHADGSCL